MTAPNLLDISVHHFGEEDLSDYVRTHAMVSTAGTSYVDVICRQNPGHFMQLQLHNWMPVDDDWWAVTAELRSPAGYNIGQRPALVYGKVYDIPTYTTFQAQDGVFSLGMRTMGVW